MSDLDRLDHRIIGFLQQDASIGVAALGEKVGLSQNACWRRIKRLEADGYLVARVALFDREKLGYPLVAFTILRLREHSEAQTELLSREVAAMPEVVEFYRMSGDIDYMAKIIARDVKHYDEIYKRLIAIVPMRDVSSSFSMEEMKLTTVMPISG